MVAAIAASYVRLTDVHEKRRLRVLVAGGAAGTIPGLVRFLIVALAPASALRGYLMTSWWLDVLIAAVFLLFPVRFAYAVLRHRLLGIRVIVRMGVQVRARARPGDLARPGARPRTRGRCADPRRPAADPDCRGARLDLRRPRRTRGGLHTPRHRMAAAIDRRFFREQYDARRLLRDVAEQARRRGAWNARRRRSWRASRPRCTRRLPPSWCGRLARRGSTPWRRRRPVPVRRPLPRQAASWRGCGPPSGRCGRRTRMRTARTGGPGMAGLVELAVPITMSAGRDEALLVFGPRRSEEPYTQEDLDALTLSPGAWRCCSIRRCPIRAPRRARSRSARGAASATTPAPRLRERESAARAGRHASDARPTLPARAPARARRYGHGVRGHRHGPGTAGGGQGDSRRVGAQHGGHRTLPAGGARGGRSRSPRTSSRSTTTGSRRAAARSS